MKEREASTCPSDRALPSLAVDDKWRATFRACDKCGWQRSGAISWPGHITDKGGTRWQFHHVIDIVPTLLEVTGIPAPDMVDGIAQKPIEGVSMAYTFDRANADAPSPHKTQYFEMLGVQGLYNDGWMLSAVPIRPPWELLGKAILDPASAFKFELYDVPRSTKYQVLPLDASVATRMVTPRPSMSGGRKVFTFTGVPITGQPRGTGPNLLNTSYTITADIDVPEGGGEGMIVTDGGRFGGYGLYLLKGKPVFLWNLLDLRRVRWEGPDVLTPGKHTLVYDFKYDGLGVATLAFNSISGLGRGGTGTLSVDDKVVATQTMEHTVPLTLPWDETFDIGSDTGTPVDDADYHRQDRQADLLDRAAGAEARSRLSRRAGRQLSGGKERIGHPIGWPIRLAGWAGSGWEARGDWTHCPYARCPHYGRNHEN